MHGVMVSLVRWSDASLVPFPNMAEFIGSPSVGPGVEKRSRDWERGPAKAIVAETLADWDAAPLARP